MDHGVDQTGGGAEPEERRRRRVDWDADVERRTQRGRGHSGREHYSCTVEGSDGRLDPENTARGVPADRSDWGVQKDLGAVGVGAGAGDQPLGHAYRVDRSITGGPDGPPRGLKQPGLKPRHSGRVHDFLPGPDLRRAVYRAPGQ